jgi:hypothetical protein
MDKLGDIAGYNGDGARLFINPGIPSVVTEYGSTAPTGPANTRGGWGDLLEGPGDKSQPFSGVIRGAAAKRSGARSITAASPGDASAPWA